MYLWLVLHLQGSTLFVPGQIFVFISINMKAVHSSAVTLNQSYIILRLPLFLPWDQGLLLFSGPNSLILMQFIKIFCHIKHFPSSNKFISPNLLPTYKIFLPLLLLFCYHIPFPFWPIGSYFNFLILASQHLSFALRAPGVPIFSVSLLFYFICWGWETTDLKRGITSEHLGSKYWMYGYFDVNIRTHLKGYHPHLYILAVSKPPFLYSSLQQNLWACTHTIASPHCIKGRIFMQAYLQAFRSRFKLQTTLGLLAGHFQTLHMSIGMCRRWCHILPQFSSTAFYFEPNLGLTFWLSPLLHSSLATYFHAFYMEQGRHGLK